MLGLGIWGASPALSDVVGQGSHPVGDESHPVGDESRPGCGFGDQNHVHIGHCPPVHHHGDSDQGDDNDD